jgi:flagellar M-ring protein FliF
MPSGIIAGLERARAVWKRISRLQRIALIAGVVITLVLGIAVIVWSQQTSYGVLFSNLQTQDASAIVTQLKSAKIPYQLAENGTVIEVPTAMVDSTRLMLAGDGLPNQGVVGFEIFDKQNGLSMTDFMQQLDYQRGLEGELTRTVEQINGVQQAWVNIVLPQSSLYTATQDPPTASIELRLNDGVQLDPGQVKAIMHLVASAVQGMKPANVTVVDTNGDNLSDAVNNSLLTDGVTASTYGTALDVEHAYEQNLSQQATSMLDAVLGPNKAVVRVNANLNWDQLSQDSTTYTPTQNPVGNQTTNTITSNGSTSTTGGVPGTGSNLVPTPTSTAGTGGTTYTQSQSSTVYDVSQTVAHLTRAPGSVQRLTVAVFLDGSYSPATVAQIQAAVANAIGLNSARGDQITVNAIAFDHSTDQAAQSALQNQQQQALLAAWSRGVALALAAAALLFFAWQATRRRSPRVQPATVSLVNEIKHLTGSDVPQVIEISAPREAGEPMLLPGREPEDITTLLSVARLRQMNEREQARTTEMRNGLLEMAKQHPEVIANVVQGWFDE